MRVAGLVAYTASLTGTGWADRVTSVGGRERRTNRGTSAVLPLLSFFISLSVSHISFFFWQRSEEGCTSVPPIQH